MTGQFTYLIEAENGLVKIGLGQIVRDRLSACRTHSPVRVRLIAAWPANPVDDDALKERFRAHRHHCEWFAQKGDFALFVERNRGKGVDHIPEWSELTFSNQASYSLRRGREAVRPKSIGAQPVAGPRRGLTRQHRRALDYIKSEIAEQGFSPSYQEIGDHLGILSKSGVHRIVHCLVARGHIELTPNCARAISLVDRKRPTPEQAGAGA